LVRVASTRYTVEQCIEEAKGETGLDEYEVRFWHCWYRYITLSMMAHAWLASIKRQEQEKNRQGKEHVGEAAAQRASSEARNG
jgi:SRSO17 transposase